MIQQRLDGFLSGPKGEVGYSPRSGTPASKVLLRAVVVVVLFVTFLTSAKTAMAQVTITQQPQSQTVVAGQTATFTAAASASCRWVWYKNGAQLAYEPIGTTSSYTTPATTTAMSGAKYTATAYGCTAATGEAQTQPAVLTVTQAQTQAPSITKQPASQTVLSGQAATFSVSASGTAPLSYQWQKNGAVISGATSSSYTTPPTTSSDNGSAFRVIVSNSAGSITSNTATLNVNVEPTITTQPQSQTVTTGHTATFTVAATGTAPLNYQWYKNGIAISQANSTSYTTPSTSSSDNGSVFQVVVKNSVGSVTSNSATLIVVSGNSIATATVNAGSPSVTIPARFGGLILFAIQDANDLLGPAAAPNPLYRQLIKNLMFPGQQFILTTEDDEGETVPPTAAQVGALGQFYTDMKNSGFTIGIYPGVPMCPDSTSLATGYASAWINHLPAGSMLGMVIGNEPDGPCKEGTYAQFLSKFQTWTSDINALSGGANVKFMGPQFGGQLPWQFAGPDLNPFINSEANVLNVVGQHWYPLIGDSPCVGGNASIPALLSNSAATSASSQISSYVQNAHSKGLTFRISEMNSVDCSGVPGVSDTFASALWVMDSLFHLASVGADGVNITSDEGDDYDLFGFTTTAAPYHLSFVAPEYYGTLVFQQATQNNSKLLPVTLTTSSNISVWATLDASSTVRVLVINKDLSASGNVSITLSGYGNGTLARLAAPSVSSKTGVTWAGQTFDGSLDGTIHGTESTATVVPSSNVYTFSMTPATAVLLTVEHP